MKRRGIGGISSLLVSIPGLILFFCITVAASVLHQTLIAGFCLFVFLICGLSRLWGVFSIRKVSVGIDTDSPSMFAGDEAEIRFSIENKKLLPLIWLELLLPMPRRACIMPESNFEETAVPVQEEEHWDGHKALKKRFSFIMGMDCLKWRDRWTAVRRGVYHLDRLVLRSGDGFGLTQAQTVATPAEMPIFVIYPQVRQVDITPFLSMQWDRTDGDRGFMDDLTVMRGMRRYEAGDPWKRINWRMAARQQELNINLYETITPKAIHFIVDGESFSAFPEDDSEFEDALSLLASLLLRLTDARVLCGLSLPRSKYLPQTDIAATSDAEELLTALAGYDLLSVRDEELFQETRRVGFLPSDFDLTALARAAHRAGRMYYIVRDAAGLRSRGLPQNLDSSKLILLAYREASVEDEYALGAKVLNLPSLGR
jgi:uncharacterized protein (DUF58 family)